MSDSAENKNGSSGISRREVVKGLATIPVLGAFAFAFYRKRKRARQIRNSIMENISLNPDETEITDITPTGEKIRLGIPDSAVSSGGIYHFKDGRTVPDVLHTVFEFNEYDLTMMYSATLASSKDRGKVLMGNDGYMEVGNTMRVYDDRDSTRYKEKLNKGIIDPSIPILSYVPGKKNIDAVTSATDQYFAGRGLLYTYRGGKRVDTTHLHIKEWLNCIRSEGTPSCNIDRGFDEAITAHMGTMAYREGRRVQWDRENETIF